MYRLTSDANIVVRIEDGTTIPRGHRFWADYEAWIDAGNAPLPAPGTSLPEIKAVAKDQIDQACGSKRAGAVSSGAHIEEEYRRAYEDSLAYKAAGYTGAAPASVQSWATVASLTTKQAADDIILTRDGYMALLDAVRDIRLTGKAMVDVAESPSDILASIDFINVSLDALP